MMIPQGWIRVVPSPSLDDCVTRREWVFGNGTHRLKRSYMNRKECTGHWWILVDREHLGVGVGRTLGECVSDWVSHRFSQKE